MNLAGKTVMPAIVDTHTHLSQTREALVDDLVAAQLEQYTADARKDLAEEALGLTIRVELAS